MVDTGKCQSITKAGRPCRATPQRSKPWCIAHDPDIDGQRREWIERGGRHKANRIRARRELTETAMSMADVSALLSSTLRKVAAGEIEPAQAAATATVARALIAVTEASSFENRLAELESRTGIGPGNVRRIA